MTPRVSTAPARPGRTDPPRAPKAAEAVAAQLRSRIISRQLSEGDMLPPEAELGVQLGVSRPTLREAFRILEAERLILVRRGVRGGAQVLSPDEAVAAHQVGLLLQYRGARLSDVYEAAAQVEAAVVSDVAQHRDETALKDLESCLNRLHEIPVDDPSYTVVDREFHLLLGRHCSNPALTLCLQLIDGILTAASQARARSDDGQGAQAKQASLRRYAKLIRLIRDGDTEGASAHWYRYMLDVRRFLAADEHTVVDLLA